MKVVVAEGKTIIYPFIEPDDNPYEALTGIFVRPDGTVKLLWMDAPVMSADNARKLAQALLQAAEMAEKGENEEK